MRNLLLGLFLLTTITFISTGSISLTSALKAKDIHSFPPANFNKLSKINFDDSVQSLYHGMDLQKLGLSYDAFRYALIGYNNLRAEGKLRETGLLSIIDFTKKSTEKRFYTLNLDSQKIVYHSLVSHGRNTGENEAKYFSNRPHSNQSSLGFYITGETYVGSKGYSLRLDGVDGAYNSNMRNRAVVMHEADYVSDYWIERYGRLGRSQGCPALPKEISRKVIDTIKNRTLIFAYYNDDSYLTSSAHLNMDKLWQNLEAASI